MAHIQCFLDRRSYEIDITISDKNRDSVFNWDQCCFRSMPTMRVYFIPELHLIHPNWFSLFQKIAKNITLKSIRKSNAYFYKMLNIRRQVPTQLNEKIIPNDSEYLFYEQIRTMKLKVTYLHTCLHIIPVKRLIGRLTSECLVRSVDLFVLVQLYYAVKYCVNNLWTICPFVSHEIRFSRSNLGFNL